MKILVFGVIYIGIENYLEDYFNSLAKQSYSDIDILIIEDGIHLPDCFSRHNLITIESNKGSTIADIRFFAIEYAKNNKYDILIFTDCDDFFSENRVDRSIQSLASADFCVNKLIPIDESSSMINGIEGITVPPHLEIIEVLKANFFGLSNSAININSLPRIFYIPSEIVAVDWWVYSILLLNHRKYVYDEKAITFYRQHDNNIVGLTTYLTKERLLKGIDVKTIHYKTILKYCEKFELVNYISIIKNHILEINELKIKTQDDRFLQNYISVINSNLDKIKTGWWSEILPLSVWRKYE